MYVEVMRNDGGRHQAAGSAIVSLVYMFGGEPPRDGQTNETSIRTPIYKTCTPLAFSEAAGGVPRRQHPLPSFRDRSYFLVVSTK